ncbi:MAG: hypothetical protein A2Z38_04080 [Planctomycetes bacterium RBG_19FT_COMBO_48_8]|nr:MAG: hypothetical protein A2Z38_04080 [Planctomycetes bacterium RBG_19FT_COMBO_48_8]
MNEEMIHIKDQLKKIKEIINAFDAVCKETQTTDTGVAWDILNTIRSSIEGILNENHQSIRQ